MNRTNCKTCIILTESIQMEEAKIERVMRLEDYLTTAEARDGFEAIDSQLKVSWFDSI